MLIFGGVLIPIGYYLTATSNRPAIELYLRARYTTEAVGLQLEGLGYVFLAIGFSICLASMPSLGGRSRRPSDETSYHGGKESPGPGVPPR
jgi:hypothetical protein